MRKHFAVFAVASCACISAQAGSPVYWDPSNGTGAGTGSATPGGASLPWNTTDARWNPLADGTGTPAAWNNANADTAVFAAGTDATGSYTVTTAGTLALAGITKEEGVTV